MPNLRTVEVKFVFNFDDDQVRTYGLEVTEDAGYVQTQGAGSGAP